MIRLLADLFDWLLSSEADDEPIEQDRPTRTDAAGWTVADLTAEGDPNIERPAGRGSDSISERVGGPPAGVLDYSFDDLSEL